ncbi:MAG: diacylglycerol kinase family lipid kinase [Burkholderiales bacterium]|nr:diacylglycerol kinase family lipid kinase [Anaerolineae bacterium]
MNDQSPILTTDSDENSTSAPTTIVEKVKQFVSGSGAATPQEVSAVTIKFKHVHIIINPASGQDDLILPTLNRILQDLDIEWEMFITKQSGDARRFAEAAVAAGVDAIVAYGGDGTILDVASGMRDSRIPMVILPGGTANVLSVELGIPRDLASAAMLLGGAPNAIRSLDMGLLLSDDNNPEQVFFHLGIGLEANMNDEADREAKDRSGIMAYVTAALKNLSNPPTSRYTMTLDGKQVEVDGINCMVTNFGSVGVAGLTLSHAIDMSDGMMDVIVFQDANIGSLLAAAASAVTAGELAQAETLLQWQAREVIISAEPIQKVVVDGELIVPGPVTARILPNALRVVVPAPV